MHPFRFGVQVSELPFDGWRERVRWYVDLGFTTITTPDHYLMLLLGGTMRRALGVGIAGRYGDIVSVFPAVASGKIGWSGWAAGSTSDRTASQTAWALEGAEHAGRDPADLELSTQVAFTDVADDPGPLQESVATATDTDGLAQDDSTIFLTGTPAQARERLQRRREATGLSYFVIFDLANNYANPTGEPPTLPGDSGPDAGDRYLEAFADAVVRPLTRR